jgi:hypothetical protein
VGDSKVVAASSAYVRIIVRRPHAYELAESHKGAPIPGFAILDAAGRMTGTFSFSGEDQARKLATWLEQSAK